jgi:dUTP pyrophosphatase
MVKVMIKKLGHFDSNLELPNYKTAEAAGSDIRACLGPGEEINLQPGERQAIPTGLSFEIPIGFEIQVRPRSGLSLKTGLLVANSPGTVDSDYRGELKVILANLGSHNELITHGDRIAQLVLSPVIQANYVIVDELTTTERGSGGFGHTGMK